MSGGRAGSCQILSAGLPGGEGNALRQLWYGQVIYHVLFRRCWTVKHWKKAASKTVGEFLSILPSISIGQPCFLLTVSKPKCTREHNSFTSWPHGYFQDDLWTASPKHMLELQLGSPGLLGVQRGPELVPCCLLRAQHLPWVAPQAMHKHPPMRPGQRTFSASRGKRYPQWTDKWEYTFKGKWEYTLFLSHHMKNKIILSGLSNRFCFLF